MTFSRRATSDKHVDRRRLHPRSHRRKMMGAMRWGSICHVSEPCSSPDSTPRSASLHCCNPASVDGSDDDYDYCYEGGFDSDDGDISNHASDTSHFPEISG